MQLRQKRLERAVLEQYGDELSEDALWELAAGEQLQGLGLSQSRTYVTKNAYVLAMLVRMHKLSEEDLRMCQATFDRLDADGSGRLDMDDIAAARRRRQGGTA